MTLFVLGLAGSVMALALVVWWMRDGKGFMPGSDSKTGADGGSDGIARLQDGVLRRLQREVPAVPIGEEGVRQYLDWFLRTLLRLPGVDCGGIYLVRGPEGGLDLTVHVGVSAAFIRECGKLEPGSFRTRVVMEGRPIARVFTDVMADEANGDMVREGLRAVAVIPVKFGACVIATINVGSRRQSQLLPGTVETIQKAAPQLATALVRLGAS